MDISWFERLWPLSHGPKDEPSVDGLVLSGGGARGSFQIGALRYLYDHGLIAPTKIVGTSAGSIIAAMLAQSADPVAQRDALLVLERYWLAMTDPSDMFAEQAWFTRVREQWAELSGVLPERPKDTTLPVEGDVGDAEALVKEALVDDPSSASGEFNLGLLWQVMQALPRIGRAGAGLASSLRGAEVAGSAFRPGPIVDQLLFQSGFSHEAVKASGVELRLSFTDLNSGDLRFMRQDGVVVDATDVPVAPDAYDLSLGVWASCAIPGVFRPVKLGDGVYVDGGVRQNVPVDLAVSHLGVTQPYVIVSTPPGVDADDYTNKDIVASMARGMSILMDESGRAEVAWARMAGCTVIEPEVSVHGSMTFDAATLSINRDYGWMRAAEEACAHPASEASVVPALTALVGAGRGRKPRAGSPAVAADLAATADHPSADITRARLALHDAVARDAPESEIRHVRRRVRTLVHDAPPEILPDNAIQWNGVR